MPGQKTVLIIEDNPYNREIAVTSLEKDGYKVLTAEDGIEGLEKIRSLCPHLVLLDLSLPELSGWDVVKKLREDEKFRDLPIIALTAHAMAGDRKKAYQSGCSSYLSKPCRPRDISREVKEFI
ncbi:MAG: response regulator [Elusimicrobiota bacterium]